MLHDDDRTAISAGDNRGRALCFVVDVSLGVFGYFTAGLASFFVDKDVIGGAGQAKEDTIPVLHADIQACAMS